MDKVKDEEVSLRDVIISLRNWIKYLLSKWMIITTCSLIGALIGFIIYYFSNPKYYAESNIVLDGGQTPTFLTTTLGLGNEGTNGLFSSVDNIIWLYTNNNMLRKTLLTEVETDDGSSQLLITRFIQTSEKIAKAIKKNPTLNEVSFSKSDSVLTKQQEAFMKLCIYVLKTDYLEVSAVQKTQNIINLKITAEDEMFAYLFNTILVPIANEFYINTKTKKNLDNIHQLSERADSLRRNMNKSIGQAAINVDDVPYGNPNKSILRVEAQKSNIDVQATSTMYLQVVQNLEISKNELSKEIPIVQIVDKPILPLSKNSLKWILTVPLGFIISFIFTSLYLVFRRFYKNLIIE